MVQCNLLFGAEERLMWKAESLHRSTTIGNKQMNKAQLTFVNDK